VSDPCRHGILVSELLDDRSVLQEDRFELREQSCKGCILMLLAVCFLEELILGIGFDDRPELLMNLQECFVELVCFFCLFHLSFQGRQDHPEGFGSVLKPES